MKKYLILGIIGAFVPLYAMKPHRLEAAACTGIGLLSAGATAHFATQFLSNPSSPSAPRKVAQTAYFGTITILCGLTTYIALENPEYLYFFSPEQLWPNFFAGCAIASLSGYVSDRIGKALQIPQDLSHYFAQKRKREYYDPEKQS